MLTSTLSKVSHVLCKDHNTARLASVTLALLASIAASLLLVVVGDPPGIDGALYQYSDLMRLASHIHRQTITLTPEVVVEEAPTTTMGTITPMALAETSTEGRWTRILHRWWPIKPLTFESENALLDDANFYTNNYRTFQTCFIILLIFADLLLLLSWIGFTISKQLGERAAKGEQVEGSTFGRLLRCFTSSPGECPLRRARAMILFVLCALKFVLLLLLLTRPSLLTLVAHQILFVCLCLSILATTRLRRRAPVTFRRSTTTTTKPKAMSQQQQQQPPHSLRLRDHSSTNKHRSPHSSSASLAVAVPTSTPVSASSSSPSDYPPEANPFEQEDFESVPEPPDQYQKLTTIDEAVERQAEEHII